MAVQSMIDAQSYMARKEGCRLALQGHVACAVHACAVAVTAAELSEGCLCMGLDDNKCVESC